MAGGGSTRNGSAADLWTVTTRSNVLSLIVMRGVREDRVYYMEEKPVGMVEIVTTRLD